MINEKIFYHEINKRSGFKFKAASFFCVFEKPQKPAMA